MRIMQLYRIESDYKNHKRRLQSIRKLSSKDKITRITGQYFYVANQLKKIKQNDHSFHQKEQISRRQHAHSLMNRTITQHGKKIKQHYQANNTIVPSTATRQPKSLNKLSGLDKIESENVKLKQKIENTRSVYQSLRRNSQLQALNPKGDRENARKTERQKIMNLLKSQFNIQSTVVFPRCKSKTVVLELPNPSLEGDTSRRGHPESVGEESRAVQ